MQWQDETAGLGVYVSQKSSAKTAPAGAKARASSNLLLNVALNHVFSTQVAPLPWSPECARVQPG